MPDARAAALFAGLREWLEQPANEPSSRPPHQEPMSRRPAKSPANLVTGRSDQELRQGRDVMLATTLPDAQRLAKRQLQDEQNDLLDRARRARARIDPARLVVEVASATTVWSEVLGQQIEAAYTAGRELGARKRRDGGVPPRVVADLVATLVNPLRDRLVTTIENLGDEGPYDSTFELQRVLALAISARYREWKSGELETLLGDMLVGAYARGIYDAAARASRLRWIPAEVGQCPDADDNALEPTVKGQSFPTGQRCPPAHPGCRCLIVPDDVVAATNL